MRVHAFASLPQYARHVTAVWKHLPDEMRGDLMTGPQVTSLWLPSRDVVMVGGHQDIFRATGRVVYVEHGAGQAYNGDPACAGKPGYHGGPLTVGDSDRVIGCIAPRQDVADSWGRPALAAGCPALDPFAGYWWSSELTAVITFHWSPSGGRPFCPEAGTAFAHYHNHLAALVNRLQLQGFRVIGHHHPRTPTMRATWRSLGVECVSDIEEVLVRAHLMIADNTSVMYEFAALDRPVVALNCPAYRRDVEHGLRFWSHVPGWQVDSPEELRDFDFARYVDADPSLELRRRAVAYAYEPVEIGTAGPAAAAWVAALIRDS